MDKEFTLYDLFMGGPEVDAAIEAEEKERRKQQYISDCGRPWWGTNPATGEKIVKTFRCKYIRQCPKCLKKLAWHEREFAGQAAIIKNLSVLITSTDEFRALTKGKGKKSYKRFPLTDGAEFLLLDSDVYDIGERIDFDWVHAQNWETICLGRKGSNVSGSLITPKSEVNPPAFSLVEVQGIVSDAPYSEQRQVMDDAKAETEELDPRTPKEVKDALLVRFAVILRLAQERGHNPRVRVKKLKMVHSEINWQSFTMSSIKGNAQKSPKYIQATLEPPIMAN